MSFRAVNGGSITAPTDVVINSKTGNVSGDIIFKTGSAGTEQLRIVSSDGSVKFPSGVALVNVAGSGSSLNFQVNSNSVLSLFNTGHNCNRSWNMRSAMTSGSVTQDGTIYLQSNIDGAGYNQKWAIGLDIANSSQDDFTIARAVTSPTGVHDVVYMKAWNSLSASADITVGLNATPPIHSSVHIGSTGTGNPILSINRANGQTADGIQYLHSDKSTLLWRVRFDGLADATAAAAATKVKAGTPADADWTSAPPDGTIVADSTGSKLWVRIGGAWKGVAVA